MRLTALWWWIDRWRKSSAYMDMTLEEQGAYRNLLDEAHLRGGPLPNDERILAKACGDAVAWPRVRQAVMARFTINGDGQLHNDTLDEVYGRSLALSIERSRAAQLGNAARWGQSQTSQNCRKTIATGIAKPIANGIAKPSQQVSLPSPSPSPSPSPDPVVNSTVLPQVERDRTTGAVTADAVSAFVSAWNTLTTLPIGRCREVTKARRTKILARLKAHPLDYWQTVFTRIEASPFCRGETERGTWKASIDWIVLNDENAVKVLEGKYDPPPASPLSARGMKNVRAMQTWLEEGPPHDER